MFTRKKKIDRQTGFSLIESMIALVILSFSLAAAMKMMNRLEKGSDLLEKNLAAKSLIEQMFSKLQGKPGSFPLMVFDNGHHGAWVSCFDRNGVEIPNSTGSKTFIIRDLGHTPAKLGSKPDRKKIRISGNCRKGEHVAGIKSDPYYELHVIPKGRGNNLKGAMSARIQVVLLHGEPRKARSHMSFDAFYDTAL